jgi:hypothetical protein
MNKPAKHANKPYSKPSLITYGTIRDLTKSLSQKGASDNAPQGATRHKTSFGG